jgi:hypothetical protein
MSNCSEHAADAHYTASPATKTDWLTAAECAEIARCSARRIHHAIAAGRLRAAVIDARGTVRVYAPWLQTYLEQLADARPPASQPGGRSTAIRDFKVVAAGDCNAERNR